MADASGVVCGDFPRVEYVAEPDGGGVEPSGDGPPENLSTRPGPIQKGESGFPPPGAADPKVSFQTDQPSPIPSEV